MSRLIEGQAKADRPAPGELAGNRSALGRVVVRTPLLLATNPWWLSLGHGFAIPMLPAGLLVVLGATAVWLWWSGDALNYVRPAPTPDSPTGAAGR